MKFLGIETSCDDTCVFFSSSEGIFFNKIYRQFYIHKKFKGVVPNIAVGEHFFGLNFLLNCNFFYKFSFFFISYTKYPGLFTSLYIGINFSNFLSLFYCVSSLGVHHLEGHVLSIFLTFKFFSYPYITLLISGGHTYLLYVRNFSCYILIGSTLDDSVGESFDKISCFLNFGYPGGFQVENFSAINSNLLKFFQIIHYCIGFNFSFSGLKTYIKNVFFFIYNFSSCYFSLCTVFQNNIINLLLFKTVLCLHYCDVKNLVIVGGCASNFFLCKNFSFFLKHYNISVFVSDLIFCTDNAAMIALVGKFYFLTKKINIFLLDVCYSSTLYNF